MKKLNFQLFLKGIYDNPDKRKVIEKYEKYVESLAGKKIEETEFYLNYLSNFNMDYNLQVPDKHRYNFDWDLLIRLVAASFSSEYNLSVSDNWKIKPRGKAEVSLIIHVKNETQEVINYLHELWGFQILRLYEIYIIEQMSLAIVKHRIENECDEYDDHGENNKEEESIDNERHARCCDFNILINTIHKNLAKYDYSRFV